MFEILALDVGLTPAWFIFSPLQKLYNFYLKSTTRKRHLTYIKNQLGFSNIALFEEAKTHSERCKLLIDAFKHDYVVIKKVSLEKLGAPQEIKTLSDLLTFWINFMQHYGKN